MVKITKTGVLGNCVQKDDNTWICYRGTRQIAAIRLQSTGVLIACRSACIFNFVEDTYASIFHCSNCRDWISSDRHRPVPVRRLRLVLILEQLTVL